MSTFCVIAIFTINLKTIVLLQICTHSSITLIKIIVSNFIVKIVQKLFNRKVINNQK